jgi:biotin operon repressor
MITARHPIEVSPAALRRIVELRLSGAPLATLVALLASLDQTGHAAITQPELCRLLDSSRGRIWQSLQALVEAGVILPPDLKRGSGRRTPYRIPASTAVAPSIPPPPPRRRQRPTP